MRGWDKYKTNVRQSAIESLRAQNCFSLRQPAISTPFNWTLSHHTNTLGWDILALEDIYKDARKHH